MKRHALLLLLVLAASNAGRPSAVGEEPRKKPRPPDVLFIAIDDLNDWVGCLDGHPKSATPNIDRLAKRGVLFTNAHCAAPACNPSRVALMTGVAPHVSGVYENQQPWREPMADRITLPKHFREHGYRAIGSGKIYHLAYPDPDSWDDYWPSKKKAKPPGATADKKKRPLHGLKNFGHFDWGPIDAEDSEMSDAKVVSWVIDRLEEERDRPLFLACGIYLPHLPWYVPKKYFDGIPTGPAVLPKVLPNDLDDVPKAGRDMAKRVPFHKRITGANKWADAVRSYLACIRFTDRQIGRLLDALDASPAAGNTIVVLWSDHGWHLGEKEHWRKFALWEEATRSPLIIVVPKNAPGLPAGTKPGGRCVRAVSLIDLYPTLVELCGLPERKGLSGESLVPLLEKPAAKRTRPALITHRRGNHAIRTDRYRYIRYRDGSEELYDHATDPMEWENLAKDPATLGLRAGLAEWLPAKEADNVPFASEIRKKNRKSRKDRKDKAPK